MNLAHFQFNLFVRGVETLILCESVKVKAESRGLNFVVLY